ncbi:histidine phosphatase family protein [Candidatus Woesearchaeota archaeon]|nr:histidine phosphatase family protein [Candidatus Woesearchaeota archaeon]MCF7901139.1 histidine phosphatase family protein [Candidatus Woesearchaeota archaeon]MCF8013684.1 histidine phosphatase family protein [Candidatus Woesearchaeota archaeon]
MNIILLRHGNSIKKDGDTVLSEKGINQAKLLAKRLASVKITKTYSSNYTRALQTYEEFKKIKPDIPHIISEDLREIYRTIIGGPKREGTTPERAKKDRKRIEHAFNDITQNDESDVIAVFCHGNVIRYFLSKILKPEDKTDLWENLIINEASISILEVNNESLKIKTINDIEHLSEEEIVDLFENKSKSLLYHS